jgi:putative FmdB family regulatory protein
VPLYEYKCTKCARRTEKIEGVNGPHLKKCPHCGSKVEALISAPSIQFKGSGWYVTDYAGKKSGGSDGGGKEEKSPSDKKDTSSKDSSSKDSSSSDSPSKDSSAKDSGSKESSPKETKEKKSEKNTTRK